MGKHTESHANMTKEFPEFFLLTKNKNKKSVLLQIQILVSSLLPREGGVFQLLLTNLLSEKANVSSSLVHIKSPQHLGAVQINTFNTHILSLIPF